MGGDIGVWCVGGWCVEGEDDDLWGAKARFRDLQTDDTVLFGTVRCWKQAFRLGLSFLQRLFSGLSELRL